jgi:nucleotide-binding universal stress UspA family protein
MTLETVVLCTDGSDAAISALRTGLALLQPADRTVVVTVVEPGDAMLVSGTGFAGGVMSSEQYDELHRAHVAEGREITERTRSDLGLEDAEVLVLEGGAGPTLCAFAGQVAARALVMGSRGRGGIKRALLGSVSDYVVRNAPCPVVITSVTG